MSGDQRAAVRAYFDRNVREWDTERYLDQTYVTRAWHALRWLRALGPGKRVLDLGCGTGRQTVAALQAGDRVVSADFSLEMAIATRDRVVRECPGAPVAVVVADALHPPFADDAFDAVMALGLVGFVPDRPRLLAGLRTLLVPGGTLVCDVGVPEHRVLFHAIGRAVDRPLLAVARWWRTRVRRLPEPAGAPTDGWYRAHFVKHAPDHFAGMLRQAGLCPVATGGAGFGNLRLLGRKLLPWRVEMLLTAALGRLTALPGTAALAARALTHVVRSERGPEPTLTSPAPADAPALAGELRA